MFHLKEEHVFRQSLRLLIGLGLCAGLLGCGAGGGLTPAKGKVTYKGQPVAGATVTFVPVSGTPGVGVTNDKGEFEIRSQGRPGTSVGKHKVGVSKYDASGVNANAKPEDLMKMAGPGGKMEQPKSELPVKYAAPQLSGLEAEVTSDKSKNVFTFDLKD